MASNTNTNNDNPASGPNSSLGDKVKGVVETVHGLGDTLRAQGMEALDSKLKTTHKSEVHATLAEKGRREVESGMAKLGGHSVSSTECATDANHRTDQASQSTVSGGPAAQGTPSSKTGGVASDSVASDSDRQAKFAEGEEGSRIKTGGGRESGGDTTARGEANSQ